MCAAPTTPLDFLIRDRLATGGAMTIHDYMTLCLGHDQHGYYRRAEPIGRSGDFVTAPEVSQMFGELIGLWLADVWDRSGRPERPVLAELGPGRGTLMADALRAAAGLPAFRDALDVHLVETSTTLRAHQAAALKPLAITPTWHENTAGLPDDRPLFIVANEFFDALPIHQYVMSGGVWRERMVVQASAATATNDGLSFGPGAHAPFVEPAIQTMRDRGLFDAGLGQKVPDGAIFETCPAAIAVIRDLAGIVRRQGGAVLIIDYGHARSGFGDTFQAVSRHAYADPLQAAGTVDLTAHVDFAALSAAARDSGTRTFGPVNQGTFLLELGITMRAAALKRAANDDQSAAIDTAVERLTAADQMGTLFKVLAVTGDRGFDRTMPPAGFAGP